MRLVATNIVANLTQVSTRSLTSLLFACNSDGLRVYSYSSRPCLNVRSLPYIDQCSSTINPVYCGVCCPSINGCCATTSNPLSMDEVCCAMEANNAARDCGSTRCPDRLPSDLVYDSAVTPAELRNQCCVYFRDGCCSESENSFLDLL